MLQTTIGQLLVNEALPPPLRDYTRRLPKQEMHKLLQTIQEQYPDKYADIVARLSDVGRDVAFSTGGSSFGLRNLETPRAATASRARLNRRIRQILSGAASPEVTEQKIIAATAIERERLQTEVMAEAKKAGNPLAEQVESGARGSPAMLNRLLSGDMLYVDHRGNVIPFPVQTGYAEGLSPAEYWAGTYGARKGLADVKFATRDAGYFSKQLNQLAHRLMVTGLDSQRAISGPVKGLPVDTNDHDNVGTLLAAPAGGYPRNTILSPKILNDLENRDVKRILVRSPTVGGSRAGGLYARDVGVRERGALAPAGDLVGLAAAQALGEPVAQAGLGSKHTGGVAGADKGVSGFQQLNQMVQVPKTFKGVAAHADVDGKVRTIEDAPAGGSYVWIGKSRHYAHPGFALKVKVGDTIEAGDVISEGLPNPAIVVAHKGIGEGRRYFVDAFTRAYRDNGIMVNRRNVELIARGLIDHVELEEEDEDHVPGDIVGYSQLESEWKPRVGSNAMRPKAAVGRYLEQPVLHYTVGTKIRPSMLAAFKDFGVDRVLVHADEPTFKPVMVRAMANLEHDPDWMVRFLGSSQRKSLLDAVHRGGVSDSASTSFVPALAAGKEFGTTWPNSVLRQPALSDSSKIE